jgi:hypothetical protein
MKLNDITRLPAVYFTYDLWRAGSLLELGIQHKYWDIIDNKIKIKDMAIGFTEGERLYVRPKENYMAVMFFVKNSYFWTHLTNKEFNEVFGGIK